MSGKRPPPGTRPAHLKAPAHLTPNTPVPEPEELKPVVEHGGRGGPDPSRYGDWEIKGKAIDF